MHELNLSLISLDIIIIFHYSAFDEIRLRGYDTNLLIIISWSEDQRMPPIVPKIIRSTSYLFIS